MKRISFIALAWLLSATLEAGDNSPLLKSPGKPSLFQAAPADQKPIEPGRVVLTGKERKALLQATPGGVLRLPSLQRFTGDEANEFNFQRLDLMAAGARIFVLGAAGRQEVSAPKRRFFIATNRATAIGIAVDTASGALSGYATRAGKQLSISGHLDSALELEAIADLPEDANSCAVDADDQPGYDPIQQTAVDFPSQSAASSGSAISYQAVVAIDTDTEWMAGKGNNSTTAMTWIMDTFLAMNVFYERDVETRLLIGDVTLRTGSDPYSEPSSRSAQLDEFAQYWRLNMGAVDRDFAALFSGRSISSGSFSGIAWIDQYCKKGSLYGSRTVGSYSYNAIGSGRTPANTALFVGHELGHNMGSPHTHCYNQPVDHCYNGETNCYTGPVACPAGGKGTIMSYCHVSSGANCGSSKQEFHPTVQALLENRLASNSPNCIAPFVETPAESGIFFNSFEN